MCHKDIRLKLKGYTGETSNSYYSRFGIPADAGGRTEKSQVSRSTRHSVYLLARSTGGASRRGVVRAVLRGGLYGWLRRPGRTDAELSVEARASCEPPDLRRLVCRSADRWRVMRTASDRARWCASRLCGVATAPRGRAGRRAPRSPMSERMRYDSTYRSGHRGSAPPRLA
jgi:hypothetical protein